MSELTKCNFCDLQRIKASAKKNRLKVTMLESTLCSMGGIDVFVHPKNIEIIRLSQKAREEFFKAWMWKITDYCCC